MRLVPQSPPATGTALELIFAAAALEDLFGNAPVAEITESITWPAGDAIVRDTTAPRVESVSLQQGGLVVVLSEATTSSAAAAAIDLDGQSLTWVLGADGYTLTSQETVAAGSHTLTIGTGALDLAGLGLTQTFPNGFLLAEEETDRLLYERPDPTLSATSTLGNLYGFHGRPIDPETGFLYFRNRYYDPELGRFVTSDPMGYVDGPNTYQYALNNPMAFSDPLGLCEGGRDENGELCGASWEDAGKFLRGVDRGFTRRVDEKLDAAREFAKYAIDHPIDAAKDLVEEAFLTITDPSRIGDYVEDVAISVGKGLVSSDPGEVGEAVGEALVEGIEIAVRRGVRRGVSKLARSPRVEPMVRIADSGNGGGRRVDGGDASPGNRTRHPDRMSAASRTGSPSDGGRAPRATTGGGRIPWTSWRNYEKVTVNGQEYAKVGDRLFTRHAVDRMQPSGLRGTTGGSGGMPQIRQAGGGYDYGRGVAPQFVEDAIASSRGVLQRNGNISHTSGSLQVILNPDGAVVTILTH